MSFLNYNSYKINHLYYQGTHVAHLLREELGDTDAYMALDKRTWFTMPDGHVWIHKDYEIPKSLLLLVLRDS